MEYNVTSVTQINYRQYHTRQAYTYYYRNEVMKMSEERIPKRSEVPEQFKWALEDIYATDEKWAEDLQKLKAMPERIAAFKGRLSESADTLYDFMKLSDEISVLCDSLGNYAQRRSDEVTANAK